MAHHSVRFHPGAQADLREILAWIGREGGLARAEGYVARIEAACRGLAEFPLIGRPDDNLGPRMRVLGFERRAAIVYQVTEDAVDILAVYYGGRDLRVLRSA